MVWIIVALCRYQGQVSAALVLGGVDINGPHIYTVFPHGSTDNLGYATMGSGSLAAMSVFEARYEDDMDVRLPLVVPFLCYRSSLLSLRLRPRKNW